MPLELPEPRIFFASRAMKKEAEYRDKDAKQLGEAEQGVPPLMPVSLGLL